MADFAGELVGSGLNAIVSVGLEEATYGTAATAEMWSSLIDELRFTREDTIYEQRGITNLRSLSRSASATAHTVVASRYPVTIRGKVDSGVPFAMVGGYISAISDPTISILRGLSHPTPTKVYLPSWTIERSFDDESDNLGIRGVTFDTGTFSCDLDGPWMFDISGVGKSQDTSVNSAAAGVTVPATMFGSWNTAVTMDPDDTSWDTGTNSLNGLRNLSFTISNNNKLRNEFGTSAPVAMRQPKTGVASVELRLTRGYIDDDLWTKIADGSYNSFRAVSTHGTIIMTHTWDDCIARTTEQPINTDDESIETVTLNVGNWYCSTVNDTVTYVSWD